VKTWNRAMKLICSGWSGICVTLYWRYILKYTCRSANRYASRPSQFFTGSHVARFPGSVSLFSPTIHTIILFRVVKTNVLLTTIETVGLRHTQNCLLQTGVVSSNLSPGQICVCVHVSLCRCTLCDRSNSCWRGLPNIYAYKQLSGLRIHSCFCRSALQRHWMKWKYENWLRWCR
jgi:hypothetical protein